MGHNSKLFQSLKPMQKVHKLLGTLKYEIAWPVNILHKKVLQINCPSTLFISLEKSKNTFNLSHSVKWNFHKKNHCPNSVLCSIYRWSTSKSLAQKYLCSKSTIFTIVQCPLQHSQNIYSKLEYKLWGNNAHRVLAKPLL